MKRKTKNHPAADASLCGARLFSGSLPPKLSLKRGRLSACPFRLNCPDFLLEISLQQAVESGAVARFVLRHFVNGVVNGVVAELFRPLGDRQFAFAGARFRRNPQLQILFRGIGDAFAEQLRKLGCVLRFLIRIALVSLRDFGIAFPLSYASHREIHAHFGAFAFKIGAETGNNLFVQTFGNTYFMNAGKFDFRIVIDGNEFGSFANGANGNGIITKKPKSAGLGLLLFT